MQKNFLLFIIFTFTLFFFLTSFFFIKEVNSANEYLVCPGLKMFKNWCAGEHIDNDTKACLMVARPLKSKGDYKKRGTVTATIYHIPNQNNEAVFYITAGYMYKSESYVSINIDNKDKFELKLIENDAAWTDEDSIDKDIVESMKKGNKMTVIGYSSRGTKTTDIYSLMGFTSAYKYISQSCNIKN